MCGGCVCLFPGVCVARMSRFHSHLHSQTTHTSTPAIIHAGLRFLIIPVRVGPSLVQVAAHGTRVEMTANIVRRLLSTAPLSPRALASAESSLLDRLRALPHPTLPCTLGGAVSSVALTAVLGGASLEVVLRPLSPSAPSSGYMGMARVSEEADSDSLKSPFL